MNSNFNPRNKTDFLLIGFFAIALGIGAYLLIDKRSGIVEKNNTPIAEVTNSNNDTRGKEDGEINWSSISTGNKLVKGSYVYTGYNSSISLKFINNSILALTGNTVIQIFDPTFISLEKGELIGEFFNLKIKSSSLGKNITVSGKVKIVRTENYVRVKGLDKDSSIKVDGKEVKLKYLEEVEITKNLVQKISNYIVIESPENSEELDIGKKILWRSSNDQITKYKIEFSKDESFRDNNLTIVNSIVTNFEITNDFLKKLNHLNYFRINGLGNDDKIIETTKNRRFFIRQYDPIELLSPENNWYLQDKLNKTLGFEWSSSPADESYTLIFLSWSGKKIQEFKITEPKFIKDIKYKGGRYKWQIIAHRKGGIRKESHIREFRVQSSFEDMKLSLKLPKKNKKYFIKEGESSIYVKFEWDSGFRKDVKMSFELERTFEKKKNIEMNIPSLHKLEAGIKLSKAGVYIWKVSLIKEGKKPIVKYSTFEIKDLNKYKLDIKKKDVKLKL